MWFEKGEQNYIFMRRQKLYYLLEFLVTLSKQEQIM